jgi:hypothetical protein
LHTNVKFHEKLMSNTFTKDIHDYGQRILHVLDHFVELLEITDPTYTSEGGTCPFTFLLWIEDP